MAVQSDVMEAAGPYDRAKALNAFKTGDVTFYWITRICAISVLLILGGIILSLIGFINSVHMKFERRFCILHFYSMVVGVGSMLLHCTLIVK